MNENKEIFKMKNEIKIDYSIIDFDLGKKSEIIHTIDMNSILKKKDINKQYNFIVPWAQYEGNKIISCKKRNIKYDFTNYYF